MSNIKISKRPPWYVIDVAIIRKNNSGFVGEMLGTIEHF